MMVELQDITVTFDSTPLFEGLSFSVEEGESVVLQGKSGSGKTTLLNLIMGFVTPNQGAVTVMGQPLNGKTIKQVRQQIAWVPQEFPHLEGSVREMLEVPFQFKRNKGAFPSEDDIHEWLQRFDLKPQILDRSTHQISGGERQRLGLIIALLLDRPLLLLDEPSANLDKEVKEKVAQTIFEFEDKTILSTSHDPDWVQQAGRTISINKFT